MVVSKFLGSLVAFLGFRRSACENVLFRDGSYLAGATSEDTGSEEEEDCLDLHDDGV